MTFKRIKLILLTMIIVLHSHLVFAGWGDWAKQATNFIEQTQNNDRATNPSTLSNDVVVDGLKEALKKGVQKSVDQLGQLNGFYQNPQVKIQPPKLIRDAKPFLKAVGQEKAYTEFELSLNRAAEKAVPKTIDLFVASVQSMSVQDGLSILNGNDEAATTYFRERNEEKLRALIRPLVSSTMGQYHVTRQYRDAVSRAKEADKFGLLSGLTSKEEAELDAFVTSRTIDGIFYFIAQEEKEIRKNPLARTTDLLKTVFK